ncbi:MAG: thioesterase [Alphaproteobacteria bacterium]|nr:thioesterase [Alphaproteobacteria bacterium]
MQKHIETKSLKTYQMDRHGLLRPIMLMNELQAVADTHAEKLGRGRTYCAENSIAWVVTHYLIEIINMPRENQEIEMSTWPSARDSLRAVRDFRIRDAATGAELVRATSQWVMIDLNARKPMRLDEIMAGWDALPERALDRTFEKFPDFEADTFTSVHPRFDDVDVNQHINNAVYAVWATEALGFEFRDTHKLRKIDINFKKEIKPASTDLVIESRLDDMISRHMIKSADSEHANIVCEWEIV